jgi:hypothetical protein
MMDSSSVNRVRYLEAKRKQLQELLASDVDTSIPSFTSNTTTSHPASSASTPKTSRPSAVSSSSSLYSNLPRMPPTPPSIQPSRLPVLAASSSSTEKASVSSLRKSPGSRHNQNSNNTSSSSSSSSSKVVVESSSSPSAVVPLTYAQKLQINARYSSFGKANEEAMEKAKSSLESGGGGGSGGGTAASDDNRVIDAKTGHMNHGSTSNLINNSTSSSIVNKFEEEEDKRGVLETTTTSVSSRASKNSNKSNLEVATTADLAAAATIIGGTSSTLLKRSTSPVNVTAPTGDGEAGRGAGGGRGGGGGAGQDISRTTTRVLDNLEALDLSLGSIGTAITQEDDDDDDNNDHDGGNGETRRRTQASSSSSSSSAAASFSSPPRAKVRTELTEEAEAASSSSSLSGSFVISPSPKQKRGTPSRLLISPSRLESSQFAAATAATSYPSAAPVTSATSAVEEHVELLPYTETAATSLSDTKQHSTHMPLALASSPSTSANSVSAFLRQLDEMDEQLGFSTESSSAAAPMPSSSSSSSSPNAYKQAARTLSPSTRTATEPKHETSGVMAGATTTSVFDILDALDDAASDLSSLGPAHVSSVSGPAASSSNSAAAAATIRNEQTRTQTHASQNNDGGRVAATTTATSSPPLIPSSSSSSSSSSASSGPLASYASIRTKVVSMSLELEEKTRVIAVLRSQIAQARTVMKARETEAITRSEQMVIEARKDLENRLSQNLTFTERLLSDKARLGSEVEALTKALDAERRRSAEATSEFNERLRREVLLAQEAEREKEKSRRAAWTEATTKEIRARTLKSLEPDVQRLLDKHRIEIEKIQQASADEIERAAKRFAAERDAAIEIAKREAEASGGVQAVESRQAWRAREASLRDEADAQFSLLRDQQRKEIEDERRRSTALSRSVSEEHANEIVKLNNEWQARLDDATRRHADMLASAVREKSEAIVIERKREIAAREAWEVEERHRLRTEFEAREKEARIEAHKLRDEQLRLVASRLDGEALEARRSLKAEMEAVLKKERDEASAHRLALREELDRYRARCEELVRARDDAAASTGNETLRLQQLLDEAKERSVEERAQHRLEYSRMNELQARLQNRVDMLSSELEESRSMNARIEERARDSVSKAMATAGQNEAEQKKRLDSVQRVHEEEVNLIKTRTSIALKRRDELIAQLRLQVEEAKEEADTAKRLMQHARQEILGENASFLQEASPSRSGILRKSRESNE